MLARPLQIGPVHLKTNLLLAPIAGYCDLAYRLTCRRLGGVGLACTDLLSPQGLLHATAKSLDLAMTNDEDSPVGMQLYGGDPDIMAQGAIWAGEHGADVVDINMGCPVDKVTKKDGGSRLMVPDEGIEPGGSPGATRNFSLALRIAERVRSVLPEHIPLTAKMRLGWACDDDAPRLACALVDVGVVAITVHGRTTEQRFKGEAQREGIRRVVDAVRNKTRDWSDGPIPVIANGDVKTPEDCRDMILETGCDGVMIGRAAIDRPWIFRDCWEFQVTGERPDPPSLARIASIIGEYFELMRRYRGDRHAMIQIRQRIARMTKGMIRPEFPSAKPLCKAVRDASTPKELMEILEGVAQGSRRHFGSAGRERHEDRETLVGDAR